MFSVAIKRLKIFEAAFRVASIALKQFMLIIVYINSDGESFICRLTSVWHFKLQIVDKNVNAIAALHQANSSLDIFLLNIETHHNFYTELSLQAVIGSLFESLSDLL